MFDVFPDEKHGEIGWVGLKSFPEVLRFIFSEFRLVYGAMACLFVTFVMTCPTAA
jgi:hypothetical protein